ncbi:hypothetical protein FALCPG4_012088 [Fusarium falciforme]
MARHHQPASLTMLLPLLFSALALALQVAPNSPCAHFCLDSADLDRSDPRSSNTNGDDIVCNDVDFKNKPAGQKYQRCLACLQDSTFKRDDENDLDWFLYNMRYSFDYCVFGYPNATGVGSGPCITSEACGPLEDALKAGITEPDDDRKQYGYCDTDGKAMLGDAYAKCHACVKADSSHTIISNFLVALEAGCQQRPKPGATLGLNDTVFSERTIEMVNPSAPVAPGDNYSLPNTSIAAIAIGGFVFLLAIAGCVFVQRRKRQKRSVLNRRSSMSFHCQARLTPRGTAFRNIDKEYVGQPYMDEAKSPSGSSLWNPRNAMTSLRGGHKLDTFAPPLSQPPPVHTPIQQSPADDISPISTLSSSSAAPLMAGQSRHPATSPNVDSPLYSPGFTITTPRLGQDSNNPWQQQRAGGSGRSFRKKQRSSTTQSPVETRNIQLVFDPPPKKATK